MNISIEAERIFNEKVKPTYDAIQSDHWVLSGREMPYQQALAYAMSMILLRLEQTGKIK